MLTTNPLPWPFEPKVWQTILSEIHCCRPFILCPTPELHLPLQFGICKSCELEKASIRLSLTKRLFRFSYGSLFITNLAHANLTVIAKYK